MGNARVTRRYRTIWISDLHLGTRWAKTAFLLEFLEHTEAEHLYLVGDVIDVLSLKRSWFWQPGKDRVLQAILRKAAEGTRVVYVPGNHDAVVRPYAGTVVSEVAVARDAVHVTADGRRLLVEHGDAFDHTLRSARWFAFLGDLVYSGALRANEVVNALRRVLGLSYWSLSGWAKLRFKHRSAHIGAFAEAAAREARRRGLDGIVCGHIHIPELRTIDGTLYANDGDWVENCTALVEHFDGTLAIVEWTDREAPLGAVAEPLPRRAGDDRRPARLPALTSTWSRWGRRGGRLAAYWSAHR